VSEIEVTLGEVSRGLARMEEALRDVAGQVRDTAVAIAELRVELREHRDAQTARTAARNARCERSEAATAALGSRVTTVEKAAERDQGEHTEERRPKQWPAVIGVITSIGALITTIIIAIVSRN
jgi:hypothetical protein